MYFKSKTIAVLYSLCGIFSFASCSKDTPQNTDNQLDVTTVQEVKTLDSLNQEIEESTIEIQQSIQSVEDAVSELDNF